MGGVAMIRGGGRWAWFATGFLLMVLVGILDLATGYEMAFSLFYLPPIVLVAWKSDRWEAMSLAIASAVAWGLADYWSGHRYSSNFFYFWNTVVRLGFFLIVAYLLNAHRDFMRRELASARVDYLTGVGNVRGFYEAAEAEFKRMARSGRPLTIVYADLDDFKAVNDRFGHLAGDEVLRTVASLLRSQIRGCDVVGRLGGDEFALLFPETDAQSARSTVTRIKGRLDEELKRKGRPVTLSFGVVTFPSAPQGVEEALKVADSLMYEVKAGKKNGVAFHVHGG